jgi:hypothetical protein
VLYYVRRYLALERADRRLLARAFVWLAAMDIALRVAGFRQIVQRQRRAALPEDSVSPEALGRAERYAHWLEVASRRHVVRARCLHRSLVLHRWLCQDGLPHQLRIGVRKEGGVLHAHAWVEIGGHAVNELPSTLAAFVPLANPHALRVSSDHSGHAIAAPAAGIGIWQRQEQKTWL